MAEKGLGKQDLDVEDFSWHCAELHPSLTLPLLFQLVRSGQMTEVQFRRAFGMIVSVTIDGLDTLDFLLSIEGPVN